MILGRNSGSVVVRLTELTAAVQSVRDQLAAHQAVADEVTRNQFAGMTALDRRVDSLQTSVEQVSRTAAEHLNKHAEAVNPHPEQEQWLRDHMAALGRELTALAGEMRKSTSEIKEQVVAWKAQIRLLAFVGAPLVGLVSGAFVAGAKALVG